MEIYAYQNLLPEVASCRLPLDSPSKGIGIHLNKVAQVTGHFWPPFEVIGCCLPSLIFRTSQTSKTFFKEKHFRMSIVPHHHVFCVAVQSLFCLLRGSLFIQIALHWCWLLSSSTNKALFFFCKLFLDGAQAPLQLFQRAVFFSEGITGAQLKHLE